MGRAAIFIVCIHGFVNIGLATNFGKRILSCWKEDPHQVGDRVARFFTIQYTKTGRIYHKTTKLPTYLTYNVPNGHKIYQYFPFQGPPKFGFWFENKPSGNPGRR
jgi:hypothetical protein